MQLSRALGVARRFGRRRSCAAVGALTWRNAERRLWQLARLLAILACTLEA
jgi:hypothetical protein